MLLLDEATSALDAITEQAVHEQLLALPCTRVVIAHRLSTVVDADRILVMEDGALVEMGTHHELLSRGGVYARLVAAQLGDGGNAATRGRASVVPIVRGRAATAAKTRTDVPRRTLAAVGGVAAPHAHEDDDATVPRYQRIELSDYENGGGNAGGRWS